MAILSFTGQAKEIDVSNFWLDGATGNSAFTYSSWWAPSANRLQFFDEAQGVTLSQDIKVHDPNNYDWDDLSNLGTIEAGSVVDSHFIYLKNANTSQRQSFSATFTFDSPIIGFMADDELFGNSATRQTLNGNDELVGYRARVLQSGNTLEGPNSGLPEDTAVISGSNNNILTVTFTSRSAVDPLRVITRASGTSTPNQPSANQDPNAAGDQANTDEDTAININVLGNDSDPDNDNLNVIVVDGTNTQGTVSINDNGTIRYNPNGQFDSLDTGESATDTFSYTVTDSQGGTDTATVNVTINGVSSVTQPPDNGSGNTGDNIIIEVADPNAALPGIGEIDQLNGTNAADVFVLGNDKVYYSDGDANTNSWSDRAEIIGFNDLEDTIQLHGSASDYDLLEKNGDTRIFYVGEATKEMIGIISGYSNSASLTDDIFTYVSGSEAEPVNPNPTVPDEETNNNENPTISDDANIIIDVDPNAAFPGIGEKDILTGTDESDVFVLGDDQLAYYQDNDTTKSGWTDYAQIFGFNKLEDIILLHGSAEDYSLKAHGDDSTRLFYDTAESGKELIGILDLPVAEVSFTDSNIFAYNVV